MTDSAATSPEAHELAGGVSCEVKFASVRPIDSSGLGGDILDDSTELNGDPEAMIPVGMRIFADRVVRTVRSGGVTTDVPT